MSTAAATVAQIPELSEQIVDFLDTSTPDLRSLALVSPSFCGFSQSLLFRDIVLDKGKSAMKLAGMLKSISSPRQFELISLIRRVRMPIQAGALRAFYQVPLFAVQDLIFSGMSPIESPIALAQHFVSGMPELRKLTLCNGAGLLADLADLFRHLPPTIESLVFRGTVFVGSPSSRIFEGPKLQIKSLQLGYPDPVEEWLLSSSSPFDFSRLEVLHREGNQWKDVFSWFFHGSPTIVRLKMTRAMIFEHVDAPHLAHLTSLGIYTTSSWHMAYIKGIIAKIPAENALEVLTLAIPQEEEYQVSGLVEIDQAIDTANLPRLRRVDV
ncbi:hypothetical protein FB45DRAFT_1066344 [Roridomyces roridus]|uniref:Uncharacterized protein n=1 Tax=Roridomyces roridus TaxID=1738132 RepID=A0AAD7B489_9AGAR|nr:hypothetical protein FB45DRAFT_1066344 [Roridomyces roridus]